MNLINDSYDFVNNLHASVRALIPLIATHGENLVGAEIGVWKGDSFLTLLQNCPNIKTLHGVDFYEPYDDYISQGRKIRFVFMRWIVMKQQKILMMIH